MVSNLERGQKPGTEYKFMIRWTMSDVSTVSDFDNANFVVQNRDSGRGFH